MEYQHIIYQHGRVARVILNRPRYLNAQSRLMREEMDDAGLDRETENKFKSSAYCNPSSTLKLYFSCSSL